MSRMMPHLILVGSYTNEIYALWFDTASVRLSLVSTLTVGFHPSWITPHPTDKSIVFAGLEQDEGQVVAVKYDAHGNGQVVGQVSSLGKDPCTLLAAGTELLVGNYSSGTFTTIPLSPTPPYLDASQTIGKDFTLPQPGPNGERQEASHPHQVILHPTYLELFIPDLGADITRRFVKDTSGKWVENERAAVKYKAGSGPRHVVFYGDVIYTILELTNEVAVHRLPPLPDVPTELGTYSTLVSALPSSPTDHAFMLAAEILLAPPSSSFPSAHLYVSNRNDPHPGGDTVAVFSLADPEKPQLVSEVRTGLKHLRGMVFAGEDDKWLITGGVHGGGVKIFERVEGGTDLKELAALQLEAPTGFLWL